MPVGMREIAKAYADIPETVGVVERRAWERLAEVSTGYRRAMETFGLKVVEVADGEPYATAEEQAEDIRRGRFLVSNLHCDHPVWSPAQNIAFRVHHDLLGHTGGIFFPAEVYPFNAYGETAAYMRQLSHLSEDDHLMHQALFTEIIGQTSYSVVHGTFGPQRCGFLPFHPADLVVDDSKVVGQ